MNELYQIFGVNESSSLEEIKNSYYKLAKKYHPNSIEGLNNPSKFMQIKDSYDKLVKIHSKVLKTPKSFNTSEKKPFLGERYFRVLNPKIDIGTRKFRDTILIPENTLQADIKIHCMWTNEFIVTLEKGKTLPISIEITNKEIQLFLNIVPGF